MENINMTVTLLLDGGTKPKDAIQDSTVPDWFPEPIKAKVCSYAGHDKLKASMIKRIGKTLESGINEIAVEFNQPIFDRFSNLKTEKERDQLISLLGINRETLREYIRTSPNINFQEQPEKAAIINERVKKELVSQIWEVTSKAWEIDRPRREKENSKHNYDLPHRVSRQIHFLDRFFDKVSYFKQEISGVRGVNKMAERILAIQPGVEHIFMQYM